MPIADFRPDRLVLRPASPDDALCLGVLGIQVFTHTYALGGIRPAIAREVLGAFSTEACAALLADARVAVLVAEHDGQLIGFAQLAPQASHPLAPAGRQAELERLYVQEPFTRCGVGRRLLQAAEALALQQGADVLWLTAWTPNRRALDFYARQGYEDRGGTVYRFEDEAHDNRLLAHRLATASPADAVDRACKESPADS